MIEVREFVPMPAMGRSNSCLIKKFMSKYASECTGDHILIFQKTFDRDCDKIRMICFCLFDAV
jgi:hypothetical protein